jgi:hypothetical protein
MGIPGYLQQRLIHCHLRRPVESVATPYAYHQFESDILKELLQWNPNWGSPPAPAYLAPPKNPHNPGINPEADNFDMTVLAALSHELGHVLWYRMLNPNNPGRDYKPNDFCAANDGSTFFTGSWITPVNAPPIWRGLGDRVSDTHKANPQISEIDNYIRLAETDGAVGDLDTLYQAAYPWASYFAAFSPDEDFVETFKFYVLTNANYIQVGLGKGRVTTTEGPLTSLPLRMYFVNGSYVDANIPADYLTVDINRYSMKQELARKIICIVNNLP